MDNSSYLAYITLDGYAEVHKYGSLYFVIMFTVYILIICSNSLIVYVICIRPNLHEPMYVFIAALCVNGVSYSSVIYPKLLIDVLSEKQVVSFPVCVFQWYTHYSFGSSEYLLLAAMSYDRYVSICKPLRYPIIMRKNKVIFFLALAWLFPIVETIPPLVINAREKICDFVFKGIICNSSFYKLYCISSPALTVYGLVVFSNVIILPVVFILYTYSRIFLIARRSKEMRRKAAETCLPHLLVLINFSVFSAFDVLLLWIQTEISKTVRFIVSLQMIIYHPLFNPLIYGLKMKEIYNNIRKLLRSFTKNK